MEFDSVVEALSDAEREAFSDRRIESDSFSDKRTDSESEADTLSDSDFEADTLLDSDSFAESESVPDRLSEMELLSVALCDPLSEDETLVLSEPPLSDWEVEPSDCPASSEEVAEAEAVVSVPDPISCSTTVSTTSCPELCSAGASSMVTSCSPATVVP